MKLLVWKSLRGTKIYKNNKTLVERNLKSKRADKASSTKLMKKESERVRAPSNLLLAKSFLCFLKFFEVF